MIEPTSNTQLGEEIKWSLGVIDQFREILIKLQEQTSKNAMSRETLEEARQNAALTMRTLNHLDSCVTRFLPRCDKELSPKDLSPKDLSPSKLVNGDQAVLNVDRMVASYHTLLESINEDPYREGLLKTPHRAAKAFFGADCGLPSRFEEASE